MVNSNEFYTYAYLHEDGTPYYIGKGKGKRAYSKVHNVILPPKERIIFLKKNLIEEEAFKHEIYMISIFGRKDLGTGILDNKTNGGDNPPKQYKTLYTPYERTPEIREKCSKSSHRKGRPGKQSEEEIERKKETMRKVWAEGKRKKLPRDSNGRFVKI
jgi:hypothetical protein